MRTVAERTKRSFVPISKTASDSVVIRQASRLGSDCDGDCGGGDCDCGSDGGGDGGN
jgi:hypothetical protein